MESVNLINQLVDQSYDHTVHVFLIGLRFIDAVFINYVIFFVVVVVGMDYTLCVSAHRLNALLLAGHITSSPTVVQDQTSTRERNGAGDPTERRAISHHSYLP